jgi:aryl-alcohol dehydrogenase-like predicted oxidoreductase
MTVTADVIRRKIDEHCQRLRADQIDLLQFHWQFVSSSLTWHMPLVHSNTILLVQ